MLRNANLNEQSRIRAKKLIQDCIQAFALNDYEVGEIKDMEFPIDLVLGA